MWVSEIMLQQTQVATVVGYFERWMAQFPTLEALSAAGADAVMEAWTGLGYYSRARRLREGAAHVVSKLGGRMPRTAAELQTLPGVGPYTAGAIASIAYGQQTPAVDGNVIRVVTRLGAVGADVKSAAAAKHIQRMAADLVPAARAGDFNQVGLDLILLRVVKSQSDIAVCAVLRYRL